MKFPDSILGQHIAVLGKTGSGKTSTAKLIVEQVAAEQSRVCILDPIKSDWWGLTLDRDGKRPGLPFHILGGPRGHVGLHAAAGKAIADLVASAQLRHCIIDMAEFPPGGQVGFFTDFAPRLLSKMRGVLYLVIEEAHLFAPKERTGMGKEATSIHWAKTMATAGRSKGIRLIVATQRTQALHNAVLGSCDTLITHRLTTPADQEPINKWLKANTDKKTAINVAESLSSLKTGEGWICSGEAKIFEKRMFPRIQTYDNTATPTGDGGVEEIRLPPVDQDRLRSIIGTAAVEAEANDPKKLKAKIAELERQLKSAAAVKPAAVTATVDQAAMGRSVSKAVADRDRHWSKIVQRIKSGLGAVGNGLTKLVEQVAALNSQETRIPAGRDLTTGFITKQEAIAKYGHAEAARGTPLARPVAAARLDLSAGNGHDAPTMKILHSLAWWLAVGVDQPNAEQVAAIAGYTVSGSFRTYLSRAATAGLITRQGGVITLVDPASAPQVETPGTLEELHARVLETLDGPGRSILHALIVDGGDAVPAEELAARTNYTMSGSFRTYLSRLSSRGLIERRGGQVTPTSVLFPEGLS